jgi:hypothetical protein
MAFGDRVLEGRGRSTAWLQIDMERAAPKRRPAQNGGHNVTDFPTPRGT